MPKNVPDPQPKGLSLIQAGELQFAVRITEQIRAAADELWRLVGVAHERQVWKAKGYDSWKAYVEGEFEFSDRQSFRLVAQYQVNRALEAVGEKPVSARKAEVLAPLVDTPKKLVETSRRQEKPAKPQVIPVGVTRASLIPKSEQLTFTFDEVTALEDVIAHRIAEADPADLAELTRTVNRWVKAINARKGKPNPAPVKRRQRRTDVQPNFKK